MYFNGQTMSANFTSVTVPALRVEVTQNESGTYKSTHTVPQILAEYNNGNMVYCQHGELVLQLVKATNAFCVFTHAYNQTVHTVSIAGAGDINTVSVSEASYA